MNNSNCVPNCSLLVTLSKFEYLGSRGIMCIGHVTNLVAQQCLWGFDVGASEEELTSVTTEVLEPLNWCREGPVGKLHDLIR